MILRRFTILCIATIILTSCSDKKKTEFQPEWIKDTNGFDILMGQFAHNIENIWGLNEVLIAGPKDYVKYTNHYYTRSHINFENGSITIETIANANTMNALRQGIITTLLLADEPGNIDLYSDANDIETSREPLLYGQVLDNNGKAIRWRASADAFADYLIDNKLKSRISGAHTIWYVNIPMVPNHLDKRAHKYLPMIQKSSNEYGIDPALVLAIMQIESSFNPYAVSHADALGLMQVVQGTAGVDVFRMKKKWGKPSRSYLFDPENNIDTGTAYLSILQNNYLAKISDPMSRRYAVITAYHGGAGSVLRVFSSDRDKAFERINALSPQQVYKILAGKHPSSASRNYLHKVSKAHRSYRHFTR